VSSAIVGERTLTYTRLVAACLTCGSDNAADARSCVACGSPLAVTCSVCGSSIAPGARFCSSCGTAVDATAAGTEERKVVSILFADVTGSTSLGEQLDPERFRQVMRAYADAMREEIEAEGGTVEKFIGDAVMAAFGVPVAHEDDPDRALRAAGRMLTRLERLNDELRATHGVSLQIRIGINTGEVLAVTAPAPGEAMATGDAVNTAARLQSMAEPGTVLVSERTANAVRGFVFEDRGPQQVKGRRERVRAFRLLEEGPVPTRGVPGLSAPMVGRDAEFELLRSVFERVLRDRRPHLVTVYGDAGVGKSRLTREFLTWAERADPPATALRGRCLPYGDGITYWPLAEILKGHAGILDTDAPELAIEKVRKAGRDLLTSDVSADPARATAALAYTVGLEDPDVSFANASPREIRDELHAAWRSFFSALALISPIVVVVEDIHWADPVMLDLLEELADQVAGPALFLCPSRPDLTATHPSWGGGRRNMSSVALDPLTAEQSDRLVRSLLTVDDLPATARERILQRAEGNPFFLEEIIRRLIDGGVLTHDGSHWRATSSVDDLEIPDTVQGVLAARIDLLDASDKRILQAASVVGRVFWTGPVTDLVDVEVADVTETLRRLEDRELVLSRPGSTISGQREYTFKHVLTRDVAYESIPRRDRVDAHADVARWLERTAGDRAGEFAELLAYHFLTAVQLSEETRGDASDPLRSAALRWLLRASHDSLRRLGIRKAQRFAEHALDLARTDPERVDALEAVGEASFQSYEGDLAWRYFREAAQVLQRSGSDDGERIAYLAARACEVPQRWPGSIRGMPPTEPEAKEIYELGMAALPAGDSEARVRLLGIRAGWLFGYPREDVSADEELRSYADAGVEAAEVALRMGLPDLASGALDSANAAWSSVGNWSETLPLIERRAELLPQLTDVLEIGDCYAMLVWALFEMGRYEEATGISDDGLAVVAGKGPNVELHLRAWLVASLHRLGRWDEALAEHVLIQELLGDRREDPPYFVTQGVAAAATIHQVRAERAEADRLQAGLVRLASAQAGRVYSFLRRLLIVRGELDLAGSLARPTNWRIHANDVYEADAEFAAAMKDWGRVPALLAEIRGYAARAAAVSLVPFADRLEGRAALAGGDATRAAALLTEAADGFDRIRATWERALTQVDLGRALLASGRDDRAGEVLSSATRTFEDLGAVKDLATARSVLEGAREDG
jgi:class 3 adenylate cyclase/tetratricopeptide (TPR) repeat protein